MFKCNQCGENGVYFTGFFGTVGDTECNKCGVKNGGIINDRTKIEKVSRGFAKSETLAKSLKKRELDRCSNLL